MPINRLHSLLNRPESGWDPVPATQIARYATAEYEKGADLNLLSLLEQWTGGFAGKQILDLGGGPGHYSLEFARRGADVTWFDVSLGYKAFAQEKCREAGVHVNFSVGYLDHAARSLKRRFDLVFNRICWYYSFNDASFARMMYELAADAGVIYIDTHHSSSKRVSRSISGRARSWMNAVTGVKVGHPFPPRGRIPRLFLMQPLRRISVDYTTADNERVLVQKP